MYQRETTILNQTGLHARPASIFVQSAKQYQSKITIQKRSTGASVDAKSIIKVLSLSLTQGTEIVISADGADETTAVDNLVTLISEGFGEL